MPLPLLALAGIGAGGGLLKSFLSDQPRAERQRKLAAETARYSPWTGMNPQAVQEADPFGSALQFGTTGAMLGQGLQSQAANDKFGNDWLKIERAKYGLPQE